MTAPIRKFADRFTETVIDDEVLIMDLEKGDFFSLTDTAGEIWQLIDGVRTRDEIVEALSREYGEDAEVIGGDVDELLAQLRSSGYITG